MISRSDAVERILADAVTLPSETLGLMDAAGRVCAEDVTAGIDVPPWDNSAMDGFAVRSSDAHPGAVLAIVGTVAAGSPFAGTVEAGQATAIMTGAPLPAGADAVVIIENTDGGQNGSVEVLVDVPAGKNVRKRGGDIAANSVVVRRGEVLTPARLGLVASVGRSSVQVVRRPRVALLCTGSEIIRPGRPLGPGQIYSSNLYALKAELEALGAIVTDLGDVDDDLDALTRAMERGLDHDALITTGGVSVGQFDFVKEAFGRLDIQMDFWKVAMKPGKPLALGRRSGCTVFGLPGNPVSCLVGLHVFVAPWLRRVQGRTQVRLGTLDVRLTAPVVERPGREKLVRVILTNVDGEIRATPTASQSSGVLSSMGAAHGLMVLAPASTGAEANDVVSVLLLDPSFLLR